jgi:hypothetical protein
MRKYVYKIGKQKMGLFRRPKNDTYKPPSDGPAEWAIKARERDAEIAKQRELERIGSVAVGPTDQESLPESPRVESQLDGVSAQAGDVAPNSIEHEREPMGAVGELSPEFLQHLLSAGIDSGKFARIDNLILVGPGEYAGPYGRPAILEHDQMADLFSSQDPGLKARFEEAQKASLDHGRILETHGHKNPAAMVDAGYFEADKRGIKIGGKSGTWGFAGPTDRRETLRLVQEALGPDVRLDEEAISWKPGY